MKFIISKTLADLISSVIGCAFEFLQEEGLSQGDVTRDSLGADS